MDGSRSVATEAVSNTAADARAAFRGRLAAGVFVVLWCTGYPAGKLAVQHGGPFTILFLRFGCAALIFTALALLARAQWPPWRVLVRSAIVGLLSLALSFAGIYEGLRLGVSTGVSALFIGAMPLATAVFGIAFGDRLDRRQWFGLALGFVGVVLVLEGKLGGAAGCRPRLPREPGRPARLQLRHAVPEAPFEHDRSARRSGRPAHRGRARAVAAGAVRRWVSRGLEPHLDRHVDLAGADQLARRLHLCCSPCCGVAQRRRLPRCSI